MADIESSNTGNETKQTGVGTRWLVSVVLLVALIAVTIASMRWHQPIRVFLSGYFEGDVAQEMLLEPKDVLQTSKEVSDPADFVYREERNAEGDVTQEALDLEEAFDIQNVDGPITVTARNPLSQADPIDFVRNELHIALLSVTGGVDLSRTADALERARSVAGKDLLSQTLIGSLEQALAEIDQIEGLNIASIRTRIDDISKLVISLASEELTPRPAIETNSRFTVAEPPESQGFWGELTDGVANVYRVRRTNEPNSSPISDIDLELGTLIRLLVLLERARNEIRMLEFDSYRASLSEAITIVDSLGQEGPSSWRSVRDELHELANIELTSPRQAIQTAISALTSEASALVDEKVAPEH